MSRTPANGAVDVAIDTEITIGFSEAMDQESVKASISIAPEISDIVYTWDGNTISISGNPLLFITEYSVIIETGAKDLAGNVLESVSSFSFTTANETVSPTIVMTTPVTASIDVNIDSEIVIEFSEIMNKKSVEGALTITPVIENMTFTWDNLFLTISGDDLLEGTNYSVAIGTDAQDLAGNSLEEEYSFEFTTVQPVMITAIDDWNNMQLRVYPNPTSSVLNVLLESKVESLELISLIGTVVYAKRNLQSHDQLKLNVSDFESGVYLVRVQNINGGSKIMRVILD